MTFETFNQSLMRGHDPTKKKTITKTSTKTKTMKKTMTKTITMSLTNTMTKTDTSRDTGQHSQFLRCFSFTNYYISKLPSSVRLTL